MATCISLLGLLTPPVSFSYTSSEPGDSLAQNDIESDYISVNLGVLYKPVKMRQSNMLLSAHFNIKSSNTDIFGNEFKQWHRLPKRLINQIFVNLWWNIDHPNV